MTNKRLAKPFPYNVYAEAFSGMELLSEYKFMKLYETPQFRQTFWYVFQSCMSCNKVGANHDYDVMDVMEMRYRDRMSLEEIGNELGITKERVRQLISKALVRFKGGKNYILLKEGLREYHERTIEEEKTASEARGKESVLCELRLLLANEDCTLEAIRAYVQQESEENNPYIGMTLDEFNDEFHLSVRVYNAISRRFGNNPILKRSPEEVVRLGLAGTVFNEHLITVRDIVNLTEDEVHKIRNLGEKGFTELKEAVTKAGLSFRKERR